MTTLWDKISTWATAEGKVLEADVGAAEQKVAAFLNWEEQQLIGLLKPLFAQAEANAIQDLTLFIRGVLTSVKGTSSLADWETAVLNGLQMVGGELLKTAETLGSNALQVLIGLLLSELNPSPTKGG